MLKWCVLIIILLSTIFTSHAQYVTQTVAGNGISQSLGDGFLGTQASLNSPRDVALDMYGNMYIAEEKAHKIRFINKTTGIISTLVGNGIAGSVGDGGLAINAQLHLPFSLAIDSTGQNLFISDSGNHVIRHINMTTRIISTVAGTMRSPGFGGDGNIATQALLNTPRGIRLDWKGNIYIAGSVVY
ncbi:predicted protein [Naegleria gruberi]|uniref:Predicted protein n=1 Tax=Naegleria gruberi TaxID=5762 RepID=D2VQ95_NAEGR|nr:uncharacterized protein NAEGRDRAFT_71070 [Naegleria gruberi]EFC41005.1 predicted protein [Naegleria gruberi]|eukprot:XP_002673749.1 predicted protein [Naegleria gruberi strain NEG-M]